MTILNYITLKINFWLKSYLLYYFNLIDKSKLDIESSKLGAIIENLIDDEIWLLEKLGIDDHYSFLKQSCRIDKKKIESFLNKDNKYH